MPDISYSNVEVVSPNVVVAGGVPQLLVLGPDANEPNEFRTTATHLGAGESINIDNLAIFPNFGEHQAFRPMSTSSRSLPNQPARSTSPRFLKPTRQPCCPAADSSVSTYSIRGERDRGGDRVWNTRCYAQRTGPIPSRSRTNLLRQRLRANANGTANTAVVNGYELTIVNEAPPVPYGLELNDIVRVGSVAAAPAPTFVPATGVATLRLERSHPRTRIGGPHRWRMSARRLSSHRVPTSDARPSSRHSQPRDRIRLVQH
ncbi:MAG: hypothetical protein R3C05_28745 [Pirellulaceae bacterium]